MRYCKINKVLFKYIGLLIGVNPQENSFWIHLVDHIKKHLYGWKCRNLSTRGCLFDNFNILLG